MSTRECTQGTDHRCGGGLLRLRLGRGKVADAAAAVSGSVVVEEVQSARQRLDRGVRVLLDGVLCLGHPSIVRLLQGMGATPPSARPGRGVVFAGKTWEDPLALGRPRPGSGRGAKERP